MQNASLQDQAGNAGAPSGHLAGRRFYEQQRLQSLAGFRILDTAPESEYDDLVQLIAALCEMPMAVITLIDENRQWFKANVGMTVGETEREIAFCNHVVEQRSLMVVPDARCDPRFADNPLVRGEPWIRFYAGAPLITSEGFALGSLAVLDHVPRELTALQKRTLEVLAQQVVARMELRRGLKRMQTLLDEREHVQRTLQQSHAELEDKVQARTADLRRAIAGLEVQANRTSREAAFSQSVMDSLPGIVYILDQNRHFVRWNRELERITGLHAWQVAEAAPEDFFEGKETAAKVSRCLELALQGKRASVEADIRSADGHALPYLLSASRIELDGRAYVCGLGIDISVRRRAEEKLRLYERAVQASINAIIITDLDGVIEYVNPAFERITGYRAAEAIGRTPAFLQGKDLGQPAAEKMRIAVRTRSECVVLVRNYRKGGELFWNDMHIAPVRAGDDSVSHFVGMLNDVTAIKQYERELEWHAHVDPLTALANRAMLHERLDAAMAGARRDGKGITVGFVDLDNFKFINESLGHNIGDELLRLVAERLLPCLEPQDTLARYGGDEFAFVLAGRTDEKAATAVVERILKAMDRPFRAAGQDLFISCSIGLSFYPRDGADAHALLKNAGAAVHVAKDMGRNNFQFYTASMHKRVSDRLEMEAGLRQAIGNDEFELHYQPKLGLASGRIAGFEALLRWRPKDALHSIPPSVFIPLAEETGLINGIGEWVLRSACAHNKAMQALGMAPMRVAVNLSPRQFESGSVVQLVREALADSGLAPECLELELTESMVMRDPEHAITVLQAFREMGVRLAIDDFGTGYSCLTYLQRFPVDHLKIDQSFVRDIGADPNDAIIARAVISLGHSLGMGVIAEGVTSEGQLSFLTENGCDEIQGHLFSPPLSFEQLTLFLRQHQPG